MNSILLKGLCVLFGVALGLPVPANGATVYTHEAEFVTAIGASQSFLNEFSDLPYQGELAHPLNFSTNGIAYTLTSIPLLRLYALADAVSTMETNAQIHIAFTSENVRAVGGHFLFTDIDELQSAVTLTVTLSDGTIVSVNSPSNPPPLFTGFLSEGPLITNLLVRGDTPGGYPTVDHLYAAEGVPSFATATLATDTNMMIISWPAPATGYVLQSTADLSETN